MPSNWHWWLQCHCVAALCGGVCLGATSSGSCAGRLCEPPLFGQSIYDSGWDPIWAFGIISRNGFDKLSFAPNHMGYTSHHSLSELDYLMVVFAPDFFYTAHSHHVPAFPSLLYTVVVFFSYIYLSHSPLFLPSYSHTWYHHIWLCKGIGRNCAQC